MSRVHVYMHRLTTRPKFGDYPKMVHLKMPLRAERIAGFVASVRIVAKEGEADAVAEILQSLVGPSMAELGMKFFMPYRSPINPLAFFVYELYENEASWAAHNASKHFLKAVDGLVSKAASRERVPFEPFIE